MGGSVQSAGASTGGQAEGADANPVTERVPLFLLLTCPEDTGLAPSLPKQTPSDSPGSFQTFGPRAGLRHPSILF